MRALGLSFAVVSMALGLSSCGQSGNGMLQSISISPSGPSGSAQFVATGTYSNGKTVTPLPVQWFIIEAVVDPAPGYQLTATPFSQACTTGQNGSFLVTAFAPQSANAPSSGSMPENVWADMINAKVVTENGFVGGSAHLNCP